MSFSFTVKEFILGNGAGTPQFQFYKRGFNLQGNGSTPEWQDIILHGNTALTLVNAKAESLEYLKLFGGCEQRNLPSGFTQVEYLESSGTQYIDPDVTGSTRWVITAQASEVKGSSQALLSSTVGAAGGTWYGEFTTTGVWDVVSGGTNIPVTTKTTADLTFDSEGVRGTIGGVSVTRSASVTQGKWVILCSRFAEQYSFFFSGKLFDAKAYQNGVLVRNLIPCRRNSDSVLGMYDTVTNTFLTNAGTGTFTAGADVVVPSLTIPMDIVCNNGAIRVSKNLFDNSTLYNWYFTNGALTYKDGRYAKYMRISSSETYIISRNDNYNVPLRIVQTEITPDDGVSYNIDGTTTFVSIESNQFPYTFTSRGSAKFLVLSTDSSLTEAQSIDLFNKLQVELGSTATTYMPYGQIYTQGTTETVEIIGKNLLDMANANIHTGYVNSNVNQPVIWNTSSITSTVVDAVSIKTGETYTFSSVNGRSGNLMLCIVNNDIVLQKIEYPITANQRASRSITAMADGQLYIQYVIAGQDFQLELGSTATAYEPYTVLGTATAENLFKVGDYQDVQSVIDGGVIHNVGIKVFDGSENFDTSNAIFTYAVIDRVASKTPLICSHFEYSTKTSLQVEDLKIISFSSTNIGFRYDACADTTAFKAWLKSQYDNGTPVIVVYPKSTATTETVTAQPMNIQAGTNIVQIAQGSMDGLELEVKYKAPV